MVGGLLDKLMGRKSVNKRTKRVLIVDDEPELRKLLAMYLKKFPEVEIESAGNVAEGIAKLKKDQSFRLVITDVVMPGGNGMTLVSKLRKIPGMSRIPVLVVSGNVPPTVLEGMRKEFKRLRVMSKPIRMKDFQDAVQDAFSTAFADA